MYLLLCSSSQCISITDLFDVFFIFQDLMDIIKLYFRRNVFFEELSSNLKIASFIEMAACKYVRNTMRKRTVRRKCHILSFFKRKVIPFREVSLKQMFSSLYSSIEGMNKGEMLNNQWNKIFLNFSMNYINFKVFPMKFPFVP